MSHIFDWFFSQYEGVATHLVVLEIIGVIFGFLSVWFAKKGNIWVYPTGIVSTVIFTYLLAVYTLWGDMLINFYYTIMSVYGWVLWSKSSTDHIHVNVSKTTRHDLLICSLLALFSLVLVTTVYYFKPFIKNSFSMTDISLGFQYFSKSEYVDILTTAIFLVGMWLMAKRKIENWLFWIVGDVISVPLYAYKGLFFTSFQYGLFTIIAIFGYIEWKKNLDKQQQTF
ncbi:MAG: nicotinamide riboside transporter PnuC [Capnocytophaga sp.]|nr:nicotinamide riboside transporter PnuC [Capnocytophaga sp.]